MNKREAHREIIRLTAIARLARMLGHKISYALIQDNAYWQEYWTRLAKIIGWNKRDEARLRVVAKNLEPILAGLSSEEQLAKIKEVLEPGWERAHKTSRIHRLMEQVLERIHKKG